MAIDSLTWYQKIVSLLNRAHSEDTLRAVIDTVLKELLSILDFPSGVIRIETGAGKIDLTAEAGSGGSRLCFEGLKAPDCACGSAIDSGAVIVTQDIAEHCRDAGLATVVCSPIRADSKNVGLFFAASAENKTPPGDVIDLVSLVCKNLGETAARAQAAKTDHQRALDMETVNATGRLITSKLNLKDMVREIVSTLGHVLETDEVNVIVYDDNRSELSFLASYFTDGSKLDRPEVYPLSDGINSWIIKNRRPLLMGYDTVAECKKLGIRHGGRPAKSWLGAPMIYKDKVVGVVSVQSYRKTGLYGEDSVALISAVANQCAVAVENTRLFEEIIEREAEKERLYFSLTHDLLSLINPVAGFTKILKSLPSDAPHENKANLVNSIIGATGKITRFAEDILVYAKIKSGKLALDISRMDVFRAVDSAIQVYLPELDMRGIAVSVNGRKISTNGLKPEGLLPVEPIQADLDRAQMERVFLNCIGNAVKHARSSIEIGVESSKTLVTCRVRDDGDGVHSSQCGALFDEYYQAGAKQKGVGLGLPSVKKIIELHEGTIQIVSDRGAGFCIEFSWPRTLADRRNHDKTERSAL